MMALIYTNDKSHLKETIQIKTKNSRGKKKTRRSNEINTQFISLMIPACSIIIISHVE